MEHHYIVNDVQASEHGPYHLLNLLVRLFSQVQQVCVSRYLVPEALDSSRANVNIFLAMYQKKYAQSQGNTVPVSSASPGGHSLHESVPSLPTLLKRACLQVTLYMEPALARMLKKIERNTGENIDYSM